MVVKLLYRGHKVMMLAQILVFALLMAIICAFLSIGLNASELSSRLLDAGNLNVAIVQRINTLDGIRVYSFLLAAIAIIVSGLLVAAMVQFNIVGTQTTAHALRVLGVSQRRLRGGFLLFAVLCALVAVIFAAIIAPFAARAHTAILQLTGLDLSDIDTSMRTGSLLWITLGFVVFAGAVSWRASKKITQLDQRKFRHRRWKSMLQIALRVIVFSLALVGLVALLQADMDLTNVNELTFGIMFTALLVIWTIVPIIGWIVGKAMKSFGAWGLISGGILQAESRRLSNIALISALLISLSGTSAILTLSSYSAGEYMSMHSVTADAVSDDEVTPGASDVRISRFDVDKGWIMDDGTATSASILMMNPEALNKMLQPGSIASGDIAAVTGDNAVASAKKYSLGDTITIVDDAGETRTLTVVALSKEFSLLDGGIAVDIDTFTPSDEANIQHRTYAQAAGGIEAIEKAYPDMEWLSIEDYVHQGLAAGERSKMVSVLSMVGGISIVAFIGLLYTVLGYALDQRKRVLSLYKLGMQPKAIGGAYAILGSIITLVSAGMAVGVLGCVVLKVQGLLNTLGVTYPVEIPWLALIGLWLLMGLATVLALGLTCKRLAVRQ